MKIELYNVNDEDGRKIKEFLIKNNLLFKEILTEDIALLNQVRQAKINTKISLLKMTYSSSIHIISGFNEFALSQLLEHIKKYNPKIKVW